MLKGFEEYTVKCSKYEREKVAPAILDILKGCIGVAYARTNKTIQGILKSNGYVGINDARVRKCIQYLRSEGLVPRLIASSKGYYFATDIEELYDYAQSLEGRITAIGYDRVCILNDINLFSEQK